MLEHNSFWKLSRCEKCAFYRGDNKCLRDFPETEIVENCKIRFYRRGPWTDAFRKRLPSLLAPIDAPLMTHTENLSKTEKMSIIKVYLGAYLEDEIKDNGS